MTQASINHAGIAPMPMALSSNAEDHSQKETEATEAEGLPNWRTGIPYSGHFVLQVVRSLLALFSPVNPIPVFGLNPCAEIEFTEASNDREAKRFWGGRCAGGKITPPKVPTSSCFADFVALCEPTSVFRLRAGRRLVAGVLLLLVSFPAVAQDNEPTVFWKRIEEKGIYERLWEATRLYENEDNAVIQALSIVGRYQGQYWNVKAEQGNADGWENRRFYVGAETVLFHDFTVQAQMKFSEDFDPIYDGLYVAFVKWAPAEAFSLSAGRLDFNYAGLEQTISSTKIVTFERGQLANQLWPGQVVGFLAQGQSGAFSYHAGVFSGSIEEEFTTFAGGFGAVAGVGYALPLFYKEGSLHLDYLYNNGNPANNAFKPYDHIVSLWHQGQSGPFGLGVDLTAAHGIEGNESVLGVTILPTYVFWENVIRKGDALEAVLRLQYSVSEGDNGLLLQQRYEQEVVPGGRGNAYYAYYMGINYLIFGDRLKLMTGAEYSVMKDSLDDGDTYNGWTYLAGVRVYF